MNYRIYERLHALEIVEKSYDMPVVILIATNDGYIIENGTLKGKAITEQKKNELSKNHVVIIWD